MPYSATARESTVRALVFGVPAKITAVEGTSVLDINRFSTGSYNVALIYKILGTIRSQLTTTDFSMNLKQHTNLCTTMKHTLSYFRNPQQGTVTAGPAHSALMMGCTFGKESEFN